VPIERFHELMNVSPCYVFIYGISSADVRDDPRFAPSLSHALQDQGCHRVHAKDPIAGDIQNGSAILI
jgi:hypothetical protein